MLFFMCCYCGVYPWRVLRPRSTKTAATVLLQSTAFGGRPVRLCAYLIAAACRKTDRKTSRGPPQRSTGRLEEQPALYLSEKFEGFWAACFT